MQLNRSLKRKIDEIEMEEISPKYLKKDIGQVEKMEEKSMNFLTTVALILYNNVKANA